MRGHFKKRGERWYYWAELEPGPDGKRRQVSKGGFTTKKDAETAYEELRELVRKGQYVQPSKQTVAAFFEQDWLPGIKATVRPSTWDHYRRHITGYVLEGIGRHKLTELKPAHLNAFYAELLVSGRRNRATGKGDGLSPKTVRHIHTMLHKAFADAVKWGQLSSNPADRAEPPRASTPEMKVWSAAQLRAFLDHVRHDRLYPVWLQMATTGMRRGEALGLRWSDLDLDAGRLSVVQTVIMVNRQVLTSEPKTSRGRRSIALDATTAAALRQLRRLQLEERMKLGSHYTDSGFVAVLEDGTPVNPRLLSSWFVRQAAEAGLPRIRLHDLRHSYATAALAAGVPAKIVSERLATPASPSRSIPARTCSRTCRSKPPSRSPN